MTLHMRRTVCVALLALATGACSQPAAPTPTLAPTSAPPTSIPATAAPAPPATAAPAAAKPAPPAPTAAAKPAPAAAGTALQLTLAPDGNEARFRVREQLARRNLPSEAIGSTKDVSGTVTIGPNGIVAEGSKITVRLEGLATDDRQRDRFIKSNTLQTQRFPMAEFVPKSAQGLTWPLPSTGEATFQLVGDLTVHGVTKPSTWDVTAQFSPDEVSGKGSTSITLDQFGMDKPNVMTVLSIDDAVVLEIDFRAVR
jgi:polyisoprenoid-binding protein YceI